HFWTALFNSQGTALHKSTAYHPQSDGQTEVVNRCLEIYLRCFVGRKPNSWVQWLPWAEYWYNSSHHQLSTILSSRLYMDVILLSCFGLEMFPLLTLRLSSSFRTEMGCWLSSVRTWLPHSNEY